MAQAKTTKSAKTAEKRKVTKSAHPGVDNSTGTIISCGEGRYAYVIMPGGSTPHVATGGPEFVEMVRTLVSLGRGERVRHELVELAKRPQSSWPEVLKRLEAAGVWAVA